MAKFLVITFALLLLNKYSVKAQKKHSTITPGSLPISNHVLSSQTHYSSKSETESVTESRYYPTKSYAHFTKNISSHSKHSKQSTAYHSSISLLHTSLTYSQSKLPASSLICPSVPPVVIISTICPSFTQKTHSSSLKTHSSSLKSVMSGTPSLKASTLVANITTAPSTLKNYSSTIKPENISSAYVIILSSAAQIQPAMDKCDGIAQEFAHAMNNMTACVLLHTRSMSVCYKCVDAYDKLQNNHKLLFPDCKRQLIGKFNQIYQVIPRMYQSQDNTWKSLGCEKCYLSDILPRKLTPGFYEFQHLYQKLNECFHNVSVLMPTSPVVTNASVAPFTNITIPPVCNKCRSLYSEIQQKFKFYKDNQEEIETKWCADINAAVNETRHLWSYFYHCNDGVVRDLESIIAITCFFCFLPIVFYVGAKLHSDVKERKHANRYNYESD